MIILQDLDACQKDLIEKIRSNANDDTNAKTFNSAYIWADAMGIKVHLEHDMYALKNSSHGLETWNFPVGSEKAKIDFINELIRIDGLKLLKLSIDDVEFINKHFPDIFTIEESTDDSEYIYDAEAHAEMVGKRFASLRRALNKFDRQHETKTVILTKDTMQIADKIMMLWGKRHNARGELNTSGIEVDRFIIEHYDEIGMFGILLYVDDIPSAVSIGYQISPDVCCITETKFIPAIQNIGYVAVEEFMKTFGNTYRYFNNEEDMGIAGLREFKQCLKPCRMNVLYNACLKGGKRR